LRFEIRRHALAERERGGEIGRLHAFLRAQHALAVGHRHRAAQMQRAVAPYGVRGERHFATAAERARHRAFRLDRERGVFIVQRCEPRGEIGAVRANLDAERALPRCRQALGRIEQRTDARFQTETLQTRRREDDRRVLAAVELGETRIEIAAQRPHFEMRKARANHRLATQARRTDDAPRRQRIERCVMRRHESVARIFALHDGAEREAFGQFHRHVLERMHGEIGAAKEYSSIYSSVWNANV